MNSFNKDITAGLLSDCPPPCLSLYQPTHRHDPDNQQDPIRFRNLVKALEESLQRRLPQGEIEPLLRPFLALAHDLDFWNHTLDGLAVLGAQDLFRVYKLQHPVAELAVVADSFHLKPLLQILQSADRYQVLGLSRTEVRLFEGSRDALDEIDLAAEIPRTMTEALGADVTEAHHTVASYGGVGAGHAPMHHGHGGRKAEADHDTERFFRAVDSAVLEHHSRPSGLPLILAALPEHHALFHAISHNPFLMQDSIDMFPEENSSTEQLRQRAWAVREPQVLHHMAALMEEFGSACSSGQGDDTLGPVAKAVVDGRVATLLIQAQRNIPGRLNPQTGEIELGQLEDPNVNDLLDDLGKTALQMGTEVVVLPAARMPTMTGIAAIYRY
ncbi:conserved hypothetical protein [Cyanobium sp. PCC 7001]|uniref:baeRF3 domain-containing protein n=1 Tax=Cyanobium sp. PCC 7001 TaxID=180281 RepID=UPI0001805CFB|nr:hypothetical protein [Cyanobium sp. PCC 7001]EDY39534.1 conserved hypothetical protein [Cyanobium sp. PCC 7001]